VAQTVWSSAGHFFGEYAQRPSFEDNLEVALSAMRGLALMEQIAPDRRGMKRRWLAMRERLRAMFENG
jgi:hypothetical protein